MILVTNPRTGERHTFGDTPALMAWYSHRRPTSDTLRVAEIGLCEEVPASTLPRSGTSSEGPTGVRKPTAVACPPGLSVGPSIIEGEAS